VMEAEEKAIAVGQGFAQAVASAAEAVVRFSRWGQRPLAQVQGREERSESGRWEESDIAVDIHLSGSGSAHSASVARSHYEEVVVVHTHWRVAGTRVQ